MPLSISLAARRAQLRERIAVAIASVALRQPDWIVEWIGKADELDTGVDHHHAQRRFRQPRRRLQRRAVLCGCAGGLLAGGGRILAADACRDAHPEARILGDRPGASLMDYKASGVDIDAGNEAVRRIRGLARSTFTPRCCPISARSAGCSGFRIWQLSGSRARVEC